MRTNHVRLLANLKIGLLLGIALLIALPPSAFAKDPKVKTMTRNLYLGADIFKVVNAAFIPDPDDPTGPPIPNPDPYAIPKAVADVFQTMQATNFPERAEALADEIARFNPDIVGLQEVSTYYIQTPGDFIDGNPVTADTVVIDFYTVLNAALLARGMEYTAYTVTNADIEMPMADPSVPYPYLSDVRLVDHDVILVRKKHAASNVLEGNYYYQLELNLGESSVAFTRGYIAVDVNIKGTDFRFVNTHLEVGSSPGSVFRVFQSAQMQELMSILAYETKPTILVGDFNSSPEDVPGVGYVPVNGVITEFDYVPPYQQAVAAGFEDTWLMNKKYRDGYTSGFDEYVSDPAAELTERIDLIFVAPKYLEIDKAKVKVVGNKVKDMTPSGLWPSDHAGVVAKIKFDKDRGCHKCVPIGANHKKFK